MQHQIDILHAKFEGILSTIYRGIHHFINVIYYSSVDDVRDTGFACFKKPKYV